MGKEGEASRKVGKWVGLGEKGRPEFTVSATAAVAALQPLKMAEK
jgi:hypothetical protein